MSRRGWRSVGLLLTTGMAIGCITTSSPNAVVYSAVNQPPRPFVRRAPELVDVFVGRAPERPHQDVGLFEVYQGIDANGKLR